MTAVRIAYIAEDVDVDDRGPIATGLFTGGVQAEDGSIDETIENPLSLAEALRWGRERADQVVLRVAGEDPCTDPPPEASRTVGRRRPAGWEFLDRTAADPPISWDVVVEVQTSALSRPHSPGPWTDYATTPVAVMRVEAAGYHEALAAGVGAAEDAARAAGRDPVPPFSAHSAYPTGSEAARANARVDANGILF